MAYMSIACSMLIMMHQHEERIVTIMKLIGEKLTSTSLLASTPHGLKMFQPFPPRNYVLYPILYQPV